MNSGIAHAAIGAGIGAAAGALIGSASGHAGNGAAIGAGSGLLAGGLIGSASMRKAAAAEQSRYDIAYTQCMAGNGEKVPRPVSPRAVYVSPGVAYVPAPVYVGPPPP